MDVPTSLAGYAMPGHGIAPAEHLLGLPGFWPAFYAPVLDEFAREPEAFGADWADVDEAASVLYGAEEVWPAFRIPMAGGHVLWIVHRNFPDDSGTDCLITHPDWDRHADLASLDGHHSGPGLSWAELVAVAESAPAGAAGVVDPGPRLLLLLPALGGADVPEEEAVARTSGALEAVGVTAQDAPGVAERLLDGFAGGLIWSGPGSSPLSGGTLRPGPLSPCDGEYGARAATLGVGITAEQERALADALAGGPRAGSAGG